MASSTTHFGEAAGGGSLLGRILHQPAGLKLHWLFRLGIFMEFIGHGACGVHTKAAWLPYFQLFAIPDHLAWKLMPVIGSMDIALGILGLAVPCRALLIYMGAWGFFTAFLRPAAGEGAWEFVERTYNYGVPLAFLLLQPSRQGWFALLKPSAICDKQASRLMPVLRAVTVLMLIGHGGFGAFMEKRNLLGFYQAAGLGSLGLPLPAVRSGIGFFEIGLGLAALTAVRPGFFLFVFVWKLGSELLYPISGASLGCWEFVERGGSYVAPLAMAYASHCLAGSWKKPQKMSRHSLGD